MMVLGGVLVMILRVNNIILRNKINSPHILAPAADAGGGLHLLSHGGARAMQLSDSGEGDFGGGDQGSAEESADRDERVHGIDLRPICEKKKPIKGPRGGIESLPRISL